MEEIKEKEKIKTQPKIPRIGTKEQVFNNQAKQTSGGLKREDLVVNKKGRVISKKAQAVGYQLLERLKSKQNGAVDNVQAN